MITRIRDLREDNDFTQKQIANYLNCSQVCYSRYENEKREVPLSIIIKLSELYGTSIEYIVGIEDNTNKQINR